MLYKFPKDFLWGGATSAHQVEGNSHNDWSEWEVKNASRLAKEAKAAYQQWQQERFPQMFEERNYISGRACDHYNRFEEDFDMAKRLGHNAHRFSIEWSRIEPEQGKFNEKELEHYHKVIKALRARGMEPFVTLWHWTLPIWVEKHGGILAKKFPEYFAKYAEYVLESLGEDVTFWMTLNEPTSVIANSYFNGIWPPQERNAFKGWLAFKNLAKSHNFAYKAIHAVKQNAQVGVGHLLKFQEPYNSSSLINKLLVRKIDFITNQYFWNLTRSNHDWIGLQYYFHEKLRVNIKSFRTLFVTVANDNEQVSDLGWEIFPESIYHLIKRFSECGLPIYITENGIADARDQKRLQFIKEHLYWVSKAIREGADVRGYFYWSLLDNFEWDKGFWPRFGLVEIDYKTMERRIRSSAYEYKKIIENGLDLP